jgi:hypothetical protein
MRGVYASGISISSLNSQKNADLHVTSPSGKVVELITVRRSATRAAT